MVNTSRKCYFAKQADGRKVLRVGVIPTENADKLRDQFQAFMAYLERKTGRKTELFIAGDKDIKVLYTSAPIPGVVWAYRDGIADDLREQIRQAFFQVAKEDKAALGLYGRDKVQGFATVDNKSYDIIRETARVLNLDSSGKEK